MNAASPFATLHNIDLNLPVPFFCADRQVSFAMVGSACLRLLTHRDSELATWSTTRAVDCQLEHPTQPAQIAIFRRLADSNRSCMFK